MQRWTTIYMIPPSDGDDESAQAKVVYIKTGRSSVILIRSILDLAREVLWLTVASLLTTFDITNAVDKVGKPLDPHNIDTKYMQRPVRCVFLKFITGATNFRCTQYAPSLRMHHPPSFRLC